MFKQFFGLDNIALYILAGILLVGTASTTYYIWKRNVEHIAQLEFNQTQLERNIKDQQEFISRQAQVAEEQRRTAAALSEQNRQIQSRMNAINQTINASPDAPAPEIIRRTIEQLRESAAQ